MKYYTYGYEDYAGNKGEITVKAKSKNEARDRIKDYDVNKGELHYFWFLRVTETGEERYYKKCGNALGLFIGLTGAALGCSQIKIYGVNKNYLDSIKDKETMYLIRNS